MVIKLLYFSVNSVGAFALPPYPPFRNGYRLNHKWLQEISETPNYTLLHLSFRCMGRLTHFYFYAMPMQGAQNRNFPTRASWKKSYLNSPKSSLNSPNEFS